MRGVLWTASDRQRSRLDRGHRRLGERRWDDPVQRHAEESTGQEEPWQAVAADRAKWTERVEGFVNRVFRRTGPAKQLARGRLFMTS